MDLHRPWALLGHGADHEVEFAFLKLGEEMLGRSRAELRRRASLRRDRFDQPATPALFITRAGNQADAEAFAVADVLERAFRILRNIAAADQRGGKKSEKSGL